MTLCYVTLVTLFVVPQAIIAAWPRLFPCGCYCCSAERAARALQGNRA